MDTLSSFSLSVTKRLRLSRKVDECKALPATVDLLHGRHVVDEEEAALVHVRIVPRQQHVHRGERPRHTRSSLIGK